MTSGLYLTRHPDNRRGLPSSSEGTWRAFYHLHHRCRVSVPIPTSPGNLTCQAPGLSPCTALLARATLILAPLLKGLRSHNLTGLQFSAIMTQAAHLSLSAGLSCDYNLFKIYYNNLILHLLMALGYCYVTI